MNRSTRWFRWAWITGAAALVAACTTAVVAPVDKAEKSPGPMVRMGVGHFSKTAKAFHYWDKEAAIPPVCARCHAADGVATYLKEGKNPASPHVKGYGFTCTNCHADTEAYSLRAAPQVSFASGVKVDSGNNAMNLCMQCHQGRESTVSVEKVLAGLEPDRPDPKIPFVHVHYKQAGATLYGGEAQIGYQYPGKSYAGRNLHDRAVQTCTGCHVPHAPQVLVEKCAKCHDGVKTEADLPKIRETEADYDGNGRIEGIAQEMANNQRQLYAAIQQYARNVGGASIAFSSDAYPYWYTDNNGNGRVDADELRPNNPYKAYTPRLLRAVYNYTFMLRDPGAAYHNGAYALQLQYDSLESLSQKVPVAMQGKVRP